MSQSNPKPRNLDEHYVLGEILGKGGFSVVRRGTCLQTGQNVAVKTLQKKCKFAAYGVSDALVKNEIVAMLRIMEKVSPHENVVSLVDVFEDEDCVHLVMELCSGGELFDRIVSQARYSEAGAARIVSQIANGLSSLHAAGVVHRDLKPENCLFLTPGEDSTIKLMDFGLSSVDGNVNRLVSLFGSIDYVAPEALLQKEINAKSDMWSLGVILYILLSGYSPFHAEHNTEKQKKIVQGEYDLEKFSWKSVSSSAKALIRSLLTINPELRPTALELLEHPWVRGESAAVEPVPDEVFSRLKTFSARRKFRAAALATIMGARLMLRTRTLREFVNEAQLSQEDVENLQKNVRKVTSSGTAMTLDQFSQVMTSMNLGGLQAFLPRIFELFDTNNDGLVDMREILSGLASLRTQTGTDALQFVFKLYDTDNSGTISKEELTNMLVALPDDYLPVDIEHAGKLDEFFDRLDADGNGELSFEEFKAAIDSEDRFLVDAVLAQANSLRLQSPTTEGLTPRNRKKSWGQKSP